MQLIVNGKQHDIPSPATLRDLLDTLGIDSTRVAVERNGTIVSRETFAQTALQEGDTLEIVQFVGGG